MKSKTGGGASGGSAKKKPSGGVKKKGKPRREALEDDEDFGGCGAGGGDAPEDAPILSGLSTDTGELDFGFERTEALTGRRRKAEKATHYKVICISMYTKDLKQLDEMVDTLKAKGMTKANRSADLRGFEAQSAPALVDRAG